MAKNYMSKDIYANYSKKYHEPSEDEYMSDEISMNSSDYRAELEYIEKQRKVVNNLTSYNVNNPSYKIGSSAYNQNFNSAIKSNVKSTKKDIYDVDIGKKDKYDVNLNVNKNAYDDITLGKKSIQPTKDTTKIDNKSTSIGKKKNKLEDLFDAELDDQFETKPKKKIVNEKNKEISEKSETSGLSLLKNKKSQNEMKSSDVSNSHTNKNKNNMVRNSLNLSESNEGKNENENDNEQSNDNMSMSMSMSNRYYKKDDMSNMSKTIKDESFNKNDDHKSNEKEDEDNTYGDFDIDKTNPKITSDKDEYKYDTNYNKNRSKIDESIDEDKKNKTIYSQENTSIDLNIINTSSKLKISQEISTNKLSNNNLNTDNKDESKDKDKDKDKIYSAKNVMNNENKKNIEFVMDKNINQSVYSGEESMTNNIHLKGIEKNILNKNNERTDLNDKAVEAVKAINTVDTLVNRNVSNVSKPINLNTTDEKNNSELKKIEEISNKNNFNDSVNIGNNNINSKTNVEVNSNINNEKNVKDENSILEEKLLQKIYQIANKVQLNSNMNNVNSNTDFVNSNSNINPKKENDRNIENYNPNKFVSYDIERSNYYSNDNKVNYEDTTNNAFKAMKEMENNKHFYNTHYNNKEIVTVIKPTIEYIKVNKFDFENIRKQIASEVEIFGVKQLTKKDLKEIKLEYSLNEERKRKEALELKCEKYQEQIVAFELNIKKYRRTEIENKELCKEKLDLETKYANLQNELKNTISDYELKCKLIEQRIVSREAKNEQMKINDIERTLKTEILNIKMLLDEKISENDFLQKQVISLEKENSELNFFKANSLHDKNIVNELKNEKFIINEKYKEIMSNYEKLLEEKEAIEQKLFIKEFTTSNVGFNQINEGNLKDTNNSNVMNNKFGHGQKTISNNLQINSTNNFNHLYKLSENNVKDFADALFINDFFQMRDQQTINSIIKSQENEIIRLEHEVEYLKKLGRNSNNNTFNPNTNIKVENEKNLQYNEVFIQNSNYDNKKTECLEELIIDDFRERLIQLNISLESIERELTNDNKKLVEVPLDLFINTLNRLNVNLNKYEIEEIYKSLKRNEVLTLSELKSGLIRDLSIKKEKEILKIKSNNYTQIGPNHSNLNVFTGKQLNDDSSYLKILEKKIVESETIIKELKQQIDIGELKKETLEKEVISANKKISYLENELENLFNKLDEEKKFNQKLIKDYKIGPDGIFEPPQNRNLSSKGFNDLVEKNKNLESEIIKLSNANREIQKELLSKMENQLANFKSNLEEKSSQEKILLIQENTELKIKLTNFESKLQEQSKEFEAKLSKYKGNYSQLKVKLEHTEIELDKYKKLHNNPDAFRSEELGIIERKIDLLENNYKDREEKYRQICIMAQSHQINKEIENLTSKFDKERAMYISEINSKNTELLRVKSEFNMIIKEIENLKLSRK